MQINKLLTILDAIYNIIKDLEDLELEEPELKDAVREIEHHLYQAIKETNEWIRYYLEQQY